MARRLVGTSPAAQSLPLIGIAASLRRRHLTCSGT